MIFLSPSYGPDLERFLLLRESIRRFCQTPTTHLVIVPSRDIAQFNARTRDDAAVTVLMQEDYVDPIFYPT